MNEKERKKVKFSLIKFTKKGSFKFVGFGEIDDENLYTKSKTYEDCIRYCDKGHLVNLEIENYYQLWFRILN